MSKTLKIFLIVVMSLIFMSLGGIALADDQAATTDTVAVVTSDPSGAATGSSADLATATSGEAPTVESLAEEVGHTKISLNIV